MIPEAVMVWRADVSKQTGDVLAYQATQERPGPEMVSSGPKGAQSKPWKTQPLARKGDSVQPGILPFL